jgi:hypothetical protein
VADAFICYHTERSRVTRNTKGILLKKFKENTSLADMPFSGCLSTSQDVLENIMDKISAIFLKNHCAKLKQ